VIICGKRHRDDAHTVLAAGGINAAFGNVDQEDCWQQHFADTYIEGYGIGEPDIIEIMAKESPQCVAEIDRWGANFVKTTNGLIDQRFFGAHSYRRTCYAGDYTGQAILKTLVDKVTSLQIPIKDTEYVTGLLVDNNICFGAVTFNIKTGKKTVLLADSVVIATGGHTRIWKRSSSRKHENHGDGLYLGLNVGCQLIDMEMVQFHPTGMLSPEEHSGTLVTEAVRGEGGQLFNSKGERYMKNYDTERLELSTRDRVALANYTEIIEGKGTPNGGVYLDISHKEKSFITDKLPSIYRQFIDLQMVDISKSPMEVAPTAHYSMGGLYVSADEHSTNVDGLFAAGEVAGGLHGANRLGGNSLAEILVFGKRAGRAAAQRSMTIETLIRSQSTINKELRKIEDMVGTGDEIPKQIESELNNLMWNHCGVVRNATSMNQGLEKLEELKSRAMNFYLRVDSYSSNELVSGFNLKASICAAEATLLSAIERRESRGSHQRSDYPDINDEQ
tara:strand:+ start:1129 stop:2637 length:1509 start_codon:yes stop_codon:yes gene_type:complete